MMQQRLIFFSGMGADKRAFANLNLQNVERVFVEYIEPKPEESFSDFALRLVENVDIKPTDILVGMSMGGMVAQTVACHFPVKKVMLISTLRSGDVFRPAIKFISELNPAKIMSPGFIKSMIVKGLTAYVKRTGHTHLPIVEMAKSFSGNYFKWALQKVPTWEGATVNCPVHQIHGDADEVFPVKLVSDAKIVEGGTHIMVANKAKIVSAWMQEIIDEK